MLSLMEQSVCIRVVDRDITHKAQTRLQTPTDAYRRGGLVRIMTPLR